MSKMFDSLRWFLFLMLFASLRHCLLGQETNSLSDTYVECIFHGNDTDTCYFLPKPLDVKKNWTTANVECKEFNGNIATIKNEAIHDFLVELMQNRSWTSAWIGAYQNNSIEWTWEKDDKALGSTWSTWNKRQPDNKTGNEDCVMAVPFNAYKWADEPCSGEFNYICELPTTSQDACNKLSTSAWEDQRCFTAYKTERRYEDAQLHCKQEGGFLAKVDKEEVANALSTFDITDWYSNGMWIGLSRKHWYWATGERLKHVLWEASQPSGKDAQCARTLRYTINNYKWSSHSCGAEFPFVCEAKYKDVIITTTPALTTTDEEMTTAATAGPSGQGGDISDLSPGAQAGVAIGIMAVITAVITTIACVIKAQFKGSKKQLPKRPKMNLQLPKRPKMNFLKFPKHKASHDNGSDLRQFEMSAEEEAREGEINTMPMKPPGSTKSNAKDGAGSLTGSQHSVSSNKTASHVTAPWGMFPPRGATGSPFRQAPPSMSQRPQQFQQKPMAQPQRPTFGRPSGPRPIGMRPGFRPMGPRPSGPRHHQTMQQRQPGPMQQGQPGPMQQSIKPMTPKPRPENQNAEQSAALGP